MSRSAIDISRLDARVASALGSVNERDRDDLLRLYQLCRTLARPPAAGVASELGARARAVRAAFDDMDARRPVRWLDPTELGEETSCGSIGVVVLESVVDDGATLVSAREVLCALTTRLRPGALIVLEEDDSPEGRHLRAVLERSSSRVAALDATRVLVLDQMWSPEDLVWVDRFGPARARIRDGDTRGGLQQVVEVVRQARNSDGSEHGLARTLLDAAEVLHGLHEHALVSDLASRAAKLAARGGDAALVERARRTHARVSDKELIVLRERAPDGSEPRSPCTSSEDGSPLPLDVSDLDPAVLAELDAVSSQITRAERQFLFKFFSTLWCGEGDVLEMGPFLGSSTRAIALGMLRHAKLHRSSRLISVDRFDFYCVNDEDIERWIEPVFRAGLVDPALRDAYGRGHDFLPIFDALHRNEPYGALVDVRRHTLPRDASEETASRTPFPLDEDSELSAVFVDGCKTWYSLKAFLRAVLPRTGPGTVFLFQDYSWMDCFFVPVLTHLLSDALELSCWVDNTYVFRQSRAVTAGELDECVPDAPDGLGRRALERVFAELIDRARAREDERCLVVYPLQLARSLALLGDLEDAWKLTESVRNASKDGPHAHFPELALAQPFRLPSRPYLTLAQHLGK